LRGLADVVATSYDSVTPGNGVHRVDETAMYGQRIRYEDLVGAVDIVASKPGYGIISECAANGTALLYTDRGRFCEYDVLVRDMPQLLDAAFIAQDDLLAGRWREPVAALLARPARAKASAHGAAMAVDWLSERLDAAR
jgi:L-arabinokinase